MNERAASRRLSIGDRVSALRWPELTTELDRQGAALVPALLGPEECRELDARYDAELGFRTRIVLEQHNFGRGEYKYFDYPLPPLVAELRSAFYAQLVPLANRWAHALGAEPSYPERLESFLERCHAAGQARPTPLLLSYGPGDYNCLHQDLYGEHLFPLQLAVLLSEPERDFSGGEFVMTEQRPRQQSRPMVLRLARGDAVVFAVRHRPVPGKRGVHRVAMRHGVSRVHSGKRRTLGIIFHDAA